MPQNQAGAPQGSNADLGIGEKLKGAEGHKTESFSLGSNLLHWAEL